MNFFSKLFPKRREHPEQFWQWLTANLSNVLNHDRPEFYVQAAQRCEATFGEVKLEIGAGTPPQVVLSADGVSENIPLVIAAAKTAPKTDAFQVVTFRQPSSDAFTLDVGGTQISSDTVLASVEGQHDGFIDLTIYIPLPADAAREDFLAIGYLILDHVLGEYVVMTKLGGLEFEHYSNAKPGSVTLVELQKTYLADSPTSP